MAKKKMIEKTQVLAAVKAEAEDWQWERGQEQKGTERYRACGLALEALRNVKRAIAALGLLAGLALGGCGTLAPPKPVMAGESVGGLRRFLVAATTRATMKDDVYEGVNVGSYDVPAEIAQDAIKAAVQGGITQPAAKEKASPIPEFIASSLRAAIAGGLIELRGPRVWEVQIPGEPQSKWFIARPKVADGLSVLEPGKSVLIYSRRIEIFGFGINVVHRWSKK